MAKQQDDKLKRLSNSVEQSLKEILRKFSNLENNHFPRIDNCFDRIERKIVISLVLFTTIIILSDLIIEIIF